MTLGFSRVLPALPAQSFRGLVLFSLLLTESAPIFSGFHSDKFTSDGTSTGHFRLGLGLFTSDGICINLFGVWFWDVFVRGCRRQEDERETALQAAFSLSTVPLRPPLSGPAHLCRRFPAHPLVSTHVLLPDIRFHIRNLHALPVCLGSHVLTPMSVFHVQTLMPSPQTLGPVIYLCSCSASPSTPVRSRTPAQSRGSGPTTRFKLLLTSI